MFFLQKKLCADAAGTGCADQQHAHGGIVIICKAKKNRDCRGGACNCGDGHDDKIFIFCNEDARGNTDRDSKQDTDKFGKKRSQQFICRKECQKSVCDNQRSMKELMRKKSGEDTGDNAECDCPIGVHGRKEQHQRDRREKKSPCCEGTDNPKLMKFIAEKASEAGKDENDIR